MTSAKAAARSNGTLARLQKDCNLSWRRTALSKRSVIVLHEVLKALAAKISDIELENAELQKEYEISSKMHGKAEAKLAKILGETCNDLRRKTRECDALRVKDDKLDKCLATLRCALKANEVELQGLELQVALNAKTIACFSKFANYQRLNCLIETAKNGESQRRVRKTEKECPSKYCLRKNFKKSSVWWLKKGILWRQGGKWLLWWGSARSNKP